MKNPISVKSGEYKIVSSGTVISFKNAPIEINAQVGNETNTNPPITLVFSFIEDSGKPTTVNFDLEGTIKLKISLINPPKSLSGLSEAVKIGNAEGKDIFLNFSCLKGGDSWMVHYSIYHHA